MLGEGIEVQLSNGSACTDSSLGGWKSSGTAASSSPAMPRTRCRHSARGGNSGIQDADNLALEARPGAARAGAPERLLDSYAAERMQAADENLAITMRSDRLHLAERRHESHLPRQGAGPG